MKIELTPEQQKRADTLAQMSPVEWDKICKHCGICCLSKIEIDTDIPYNKTSVFYLKQCCEHFDIITHKCSVYEKRLDKPHCEKVDMNLILNTNSLPSSCGYIEYIFGPAKNPAQVDFSEIKSVSYDKSQTFEKLRKNIIPESFLWNKRNR